MFRRIEDTMPADPSFAPDLKELGFFVNDDGHIRMINAPDKPFVLNATNSERVNEVRREAFQTCVRKEVEERLAKLRLNRIYLPQFTTEQPEEPSIPILAPVPDTLKASKRVIALINDTTQDLGILSYGHIQREGGVDSGSIVNFAEELIKRSSNKTIEQDTEISQDGNKLEDKSTTTSLIVMNAGQLLYSHKHHQAMTLRSWSAMPRKSICHDMIHIHQGNYVEGHRTAHEHVKSVFDGVLCNPDHVATDAEIYVIAIENGTENFLNLLVDDFPKYGTRLTALALIHCTIDDSQIKTPQLRAFLHRCARQWKLNDSTSNPLVCTDLPKSYSRPKHPGLAGLLHDTHLDDTSPSPASSASTGTEWASGQDVVCPTYGGGEEPSAEYVFTDAGVQRAVLDFFEEVAHDDSMQEGEGEQSQVVEWEPMIEGPKVPFAGTMVESELLKAAGLTE